MRARDRDRAYKFFGHDKTVSTCACVRARSNSGNLISMPERERFLYDFFKLTFTYFYVPEGALCCNYSKDVRNTRYLHAYLPRRREEQIFT